MLTDCTASQFRCDNGQCVTIRSMCDGISYCMDRSDQANCCEYPQINLSVYQSCLFRHILPTSCWSSCDRTIPF